MEVFVLWLLGAAIGGVMGNRADHLFCQVMQKLHQRITSCSPEFEQLNRAIRKVYLQATLVVLNAYDSQVSGTGDAALLARALHVPNSDNPTTSQWVRKVRSAIGLELRGLAQSEYVSFTLYPEEQIELFLQASGQTSAQRAQDFTSRLKEQLIRELDSHSSASPITPLGLLGSNTTPAEVIDMIRNGWDENSAGHMVRMDWFELLCAFFVNEVNSNPKVREVLDHELLVELNIDGNALDLQQIELQFRQIGRETVNRLSNIEDRLIELGRHQSMAFNNLAGRLDELVPALAFLPDVLESTESVQRMSKLLFRQSLQLDYERYSGTETANRVSEIVQRSARVFVGRRTEIQKLDSFVETKSSGSLLVTAQAGFGKTTLLGGWISRGVKDGYFVYHFFNNKYTESTFSVTHALQNMLRQLYVYYGLAAASIPENERALRDVINGLVQERGSTPGEKLIIVIDGLDEADHPFFAPFSFPLPAGVFLIAAARSEHAEEAETLQGWSEDAASLHIDKVERQDIVEWLTHAGSGKLKTHADEKEFIDQIEEKTGAFPLYLRFLIEDLLMAFEQGRAPGEILEESPKGFAAYVRHQFSLLAQSPSVRNDARIQRLFSILTISFGELTERELLALTDLNRWDLESLPWLVSRWFRVRKQDTGAAYSFAHPFLAAEFERTLGDAAREARITLVAYCANWRENDSKYALLYYAPHLKEMKKWDDLFQLAENKEFEQRLINKFTDDPGLPLRTVQTSLLGAIESDRVVAMASLLFRHVELASKVAEQETPLDALAQGSIDRAVKLAANFDEPVPLLWKMAIVTELTEMGQLKEAAQLFHEITAANKRMAGWYAEIAVAILCRLTIAFDQTVIVNATRRLLNSFFVRAFVVALLRRRDSQAVDLALELTPLIGDHSEREKTIGIVSMALANHDRWDEARQNINEIQDPWSRAWALTDLISVAIEKGDAARAAELFSVVEALAQAAEKDGAITLNWHLAKAASLIAVSKFPDDMETVESLVVRIKSLATQTRRDTFKTRVLAELARTYALTNQHAAAEETLDEAIRITSFFQYAREAARSFAYISRVYWIADNHEAAITTLDRAVRAGSQVDEEFIRAEIAEEIAKDCVFFGELQRAVDLAYSVTNRGTTAKILTEVAKLLVAQGRTAEAFQLAEHKPHWVAARLLGGIASSLMTHGEMAKAQEMLIASFMKMRIFFSEHPSLPIIQALANLARVYLDSGEKTKGDNLVNLAVTNATRHRDLVKRAWHIIDLVKSIHRPENVELVRQLLEDAYRDSLQIEKPIARISMLSRIAANTFQFGSESRGEEMFRDIETLLVGIRDPFEKTRALCLVGGAMAMAGLTEKANQVLDQAEQTASTIRLFTLQKRSFAVIALAYAKVGFVDDAHRLLQLQQVSQFADGQEAQVIVLALSGDSNEALSRAGDIRDPRYRARSLRRVAEIEIRKGNTQRGVRIARLMLSRIGIESDPVSLPQIMKAIANVHDLSSFKQLLVYNANRRGSVFTMLGLLSRLYPTHVEQLEELLRTHLGPELTEPNVLPETSPVSQI
ncbi:MAG TPA: ATP-binding protein [Pyrinomonadaceae bacterium]|nr:ATP-binding protein [Pyrinomonadaceae bacterium]